MTHTAQAPGAVPPPDPAGRLLTATALLEATAALVGVASVSGDEAALADLVERRLRERAPRLDLVRVGNNVVARRPARGGGVPRVLLAGHLDTVPQMPRPQAPPAPDTVAGLGAVDMKGGLAVMLDLAGRAADAPMDLGFVFYDKEEIGSRRSGMNLLFAEHRDLVDADLAILLEPTDGLVEAGCQGNLVVELGFHGTPAHTARPWRGVNAVHRAAAAIARIAAHDPRPVVIDGLAYRESLSVVGVQGGIQGNVVPDRCTVRVNYRHAATRDSAAAAGLVASLAPEADETTVVLSSPPAPPDLRHPLVARLVAATGQAPRPKLGWTDVGRFAAHGIPAVNFGPGDSELAHGPHEVVSRDELDACRDVLAGLLLSP
ncbi:succinyl-diaminopimelate desuccinylase [Streptomyces sp. NPDC048527]|uniref:succinyl-diaminopimelate desuccinylase n=1 Tax=Streptomyces sp. NPDC048527 TaxID=3365568 RepID=UPI0037225566